MAQVIALAGNGLATVALALLAHDLAGERAGAVLGAALTLKMIAYVGLAPVFGAIALVALLHRVVNQSGEAVAEFTERAIFMPA